MSTSIDTDRGGKMERSWRIPAARGRDAPAEPCSFVPINWAGQLELEVDNQLTLAGGHRGVEGSVMPQISYRPSSDWLLALGEQASRQRQLELGRDDN